MRFIFVSDLHSNKKLYAELEKLILDVNANALIIGGDLFDYSPFVEPQLAFARGVLLEFFKKIKIKTYLIPGNCDKCSTLSVNPGSGESLQAVIFDINTAGELTNIKHNIFGELSL